MEAEKSHLSTVCKPGPRKVGGIVPVDLRTRRPWSKVLVRALKALVNGGDGSLIAGWQQLHNSVNLLKKKLSNCTLKMDKIHDM